LAVFKILCNIILLGLTPNLNKLLEGICADLDAVHQLLKKYCALDTADKMGMQCSSLLASRQPVILFAGKLFITFVTDFDIPMNLVLLIKMCLHDTYVL